MWELGLYLNIIASIQYSYKLTSETKRFQPIRGNAANNIEAPHTNTIMKFACNEYKFSTNNPKHINSMLCSSDCNYIVNT